jgi:hypothetical protein
MAATHTIASFFLHFYCSTLFYSVLMSSYSIDIGDDVRQRLENSVAQRRLIVATAVAVSYMAAASGDMIVA